MRISDWSSDVCSSDLSQLRILLATYVSLAPSLPTKMATRCGRLPADARNAAASRLMSSLIFADTSFPSSSCIFLIQFQHRHEGRLRDFHVADLAHALLPRSEERRVGKEWVSTC